MRRLVADGSSRQGRTPGQWDPEHADAGGITAVPSEWNGWYVQQPQSWYNNGIKPSVCFEALLKE